MTMLILRGVAVLVIVALTVASGVLNVWGWRSEVDGAAADLMTTLVVCSEVLGAVSVAWAFLVWSRSPAQAVAAVAFGLAFAAFNAWSGHFALERVWSARSEAPPAAASTTLEADRAVVAAHLAVLEAPDLSATAGVVAFQTAAAAAGIYGGEVDGKPGGLTTAALAAAPDAATLLRERRGALDREIAAARANEASAPRRGLIFWAVVGLIESAKALGLWVFGVHGSRRDPGSSPGPDRDEAMSDELDRRKPVRQAGYIQMRNGKPVYVRPARRKARGAIVAD